MANAKTEYTNVTMTDGRVVAFAGKRKLNKTATVSDDGFTVSVRLDFVNGETREFAIEANAPLFAKFAAHGAEQKIGDEIAGLEDVEDAVMAVDELLDRLNAGEWAAKREKTGLAGASVLAKALVKHSGKTIEQVKQFLSGKSSKEKLALRSNAAIAPIIAELEANKKVKEKEVIDTDSMLDEIA